MTGPTLAEDELKAIEIIRKVTKAATGQELTEAQAIELFQKTKEKMLDAMAQSKVES